MCALEAAKEVFVFFGDAGELLDALLAVEGVGAGRADELNLKEVKVTGMNVNHQHFLQQDPILVLNFLVLIEQHLLFFALLLKVIRYSRRPIIEQ